MVSFSLTSGKLASVRLDARSWRTAFKVVSRRIRSAFAWAYSVVKVLTWALMTLLSWSANSSASSRSRNSISASSERITWSRSGLRRAWMTPYTCLVRSRLSSMLPATNSSM